MAMCSGGADTDGSAMTPAPSFNGQVPSLTQYAGGVTPLKSPRLLPPCVTHAIASRARLDELGQHSGECGGIVGIDETAGIANDFRQRAALRGHHWHANRQRLERGHPEPFHVRG